jgi:hypothetical protein
MNLAGSVARHKNRGGAATPPYLVGFMERLRSEQELGRLPWLRPTVLIWSRPVRLRWIGGIIRRHTDGFIFKLAKNGSPEPFVVFSSSPGLWHEQCLSVALWSLIPYG